MYVKIGNEYKNIKPLSRIWFYFKRKEYSILDNLSNLDKNELREDMQDELKRIFGKSDSYIIRVKDKRFRKHSIISYSWRLSVNNYSRFIDFAIMYDFNAMNYNKQRIIIKKLREAKKKRLKIGKKIKYQNHRLNRNMFTVKELLQMINEVKPKPMDYSIFFEDIVNS